jgi:L-alanine-DL-glutamate epimerase-like enolase superfamily enzyme
MKITNVRTMLLTGPDPHGLGGQTRDWSILLVKIETDDGLYGLGEAPAMMGVREAIEYIKSHLIGRSIFDVRPLVTEMLYGKLPPGGEPSMSPTATPTGPIVWGTSGVEVALCDLIGKALSTPVYNLFGGKYRDRIRIYLDRSGAEELDDLEAWRELGRNAVARGFDTMKFDIDFLAPDYTRDVWNRIITARQMNKIVERLSAVREAVGPDIDIAVDGHMYYSVPDALRLAQELAPLKLMWLEDPTPITNPDAMATLRAKSLIPICVGEMFIAEQFRLFIDRGACDIIHPDVLFCGGLHEARKIASYAELNYIPMAMHNNGSALNTIASAHVAAATPNFMGLEYHFHDAPWIGEVVDRGVPLFEDGHVRLTDAPGLGVVLNEDICRKYLVAGEEMF